MKYFDQFTLALAWIAAILFALTGAMLTYEVVMRYFFIAPTIWAAELSQLCLIWGSLIAMAWALRWGRHIAVDAVAVLLPVPIRRQTDAMAMIVVGLFSVIVVWKGGLIFWDSFERGRTTATMLDLPSWISELSVPFGFAILAVQSGIELIATLRGQRDAGREAHLE
ncbi:MAG: TRAP transporter small permease [Alphaproteobacteria bacterium]|nr:TRAP transporter small permease [Alphaproteobacteria bacterium]